MKQNHPLVIIGAGPAGLAAAATASERGLECVLLDEQPQPGGQIYRAVTSTPCRDHALLGADYWHGEHLTDVLRESRVDYRPGHMVWQLTRDREIGVLADDRTYFIDAEQVILATGAQERAFPIEGWTLPGVMGAGAAQILLKSSGVVPEAPVLLAGSGPLLYLVAAQYHRAGVPIAALLETTSRNNYRQAIRHAGGALRGARYLLKGWGLIREIRRAGIQHIRNVTSLRAEGDEKLAQVSWQTASRPKQWKSLAAETLLLHQGVVPNIQITRALDMPHDWNKRQLCWQPRIDGWGEGEVAGIRVAGDGGGIGGAKAAELSGRLCAFGALAALDRIDISRRDAESAALRRQLNHEMAIRPFLDALYRPADHWRRPANHVVVCRCEEVTAGQIREVAASGCMGPNQMKSFTRCGMGPCQGRMCGLTVTEILAEAHRLSPERIGYYRLRPPFKPLTLAQLASAVQPDAPTSKRSEAATETNAEST